MLVMIIIETSVSSPQSHALGPLCWKMRVLKETSGGQSYSNWTVQNADCRHLFSELENNGTIVVMFSFAW